MTEPKDKEELLKALHLAKANINKQFGSGSIVGIEGSNLGPWPSVPTGALSVDLALGIGGWPKGRTVELFGPEGSGKSTMCCHAIAEAQKTGGICAYIDTEHALDPVYAKAIGVDLDPDKLILSQPSSAEEAFQIMETLIKTGAISVVIVDSVASLVPLDELNAGMDKWQVGLLPRLMGKAIRKMEGIIADTGTLVIFVNQIRYKVGMDAMFGNPETTPGGMKLLYAASVRMRIQQKGKPLVDSNGELYGITVEAKIIKNRMGDPFKKAQFDLIFGKGIDNAGCVIDAAIDKGILMQGGSWIKWPDGSIFAQGRSKAIESLREDPGLENKLRDMILNEGL